MSLLQNLLKYFKDQLKATAVFTSVPLSLLLFGLEALIDVQFSCPCSTWWNALLSALMFIAPPCFVFMLMFLLTRPLKNTSICCCLGCMICIGTRQDKVKKFQTVLLCFKSLLHCLIPPVVWVMLLFYDGDYLACGVTEWNGVYVYDDELHAKWCKPTGKNANRETQLRDVTLDYIVLSKIISYVLLIVFSIATVCVVIVYDICGCEKSTCCRDSEQESLEEGIDLSTEA